MKSRTISLLILFILFSKSVLSESTDFGIWYKLDVKYSLTKKLEVDLSPMIRTFRNGSKIENAFLEAGVSYDLLKYLTIAGAYRFNITLENDGALHNRYKWIGDIKGTGEVGRFEFSGRFRFQRQDKTYFEDTNDKIPDYYGRIKIKTEYKTPSFPINPNISFETFSRMFEAVEKRVDKYRIGLGFEYSLNKKNSFEVEYMYEWDYFPQVKRMNLVVLTYDLKFKRN